MDPNWELIVNFVVAMIAIVNPVEKIPLWVEASEGGETGFQWRLAGLIIVSSAMILLQFGFSMLKGTAVELKKEGIDMAKTLNARVIQRYQQIFIPIGVPVIAGPGAITTVIIYGTQSHDFQTRLFMSLALLAVLAILYLTMITGPFIQKITGKMPLKPILPSIRNGADRHRRPVHGGRTGRNIPGLGERIDIMKAIIKNILTKTGKAFRNKNTLSSSLEDCLWFGQQKASSYPFND